LAIEWPRSLYGWKSMFATGSLDVGSFFDLECASFGPAMQYFAKGAVFPLVLFTVSTTYGLCTLTTTSSKTRYTKSHFVNALGVIMTVALVPLTSSGAAPFMCYEHPLGRASLTRFSDVLCGSSDHIAMIFVGVFTLMISITFIAAVLRRIWTAPKHILTLSQERRSKYLAQSAFLLIRTKPGRWQWGVVLMFRGILIGMMPAVTSTRSDVQLALLASILLAFGILHASLKPFRIPLVNAVDDNSAVWLTAGVVFASLAQARRATTTQGDESDADIGPWHACLACVTIPIALTLSLCLATVFVAILSAVHPSSSIVGSAIRLCSLQGPADTEALAERISHVSGYLSDRSVKETKTFLQQLEPEEISTVKRFITCMDSSTSLRLGSFCVRAQVYACTPDPSTGTGSSDNLGSDSSRVTPPLSVVPVMRRVGFE